MTVVLEGKNSFFLGSRAYLIEDAHESAWAERTVKPNPALKYVLGKYVEADTPNKNKQFWALGQLQMAQPSISYAPMNLLHHSHQIVGTFVDTEMLYPTEGADEEGNQSPYIEALGVFWKYYFPNELKVIEAAHATGSLYFSMECLSESITCAGENGCGLEFPYMGPRSSSYCAHINEATSIKQLNKPHFLAGALIFPPEKPGWAGAKITDLSSLMKEYQAECEVAYEAVKEESPHLDAAEWESLMAYLVQHSQARDVPQAEREKLAKKGQAMSDGSFPVANVSDLRNAIKLAGQAKDPAAARKYIKKRAAALGAEALIPDEWK